MSALVANVVQGLGEGFLQDKATGFAEEHFQPTKDPFYEKLPNGKQIRRRLPDYCTKQESKAWKNLQNKAWMHDRNICGCCCWTSGIGWAPMLAFLPVIGPALMYWVHGQLINYANKQYHLPQDLLMKLHANIGIDLAISLVPALGILFAWLHACSTRNSAMIYNFVCERALEKANMEKRAKEQEMIQRENARSRRPDHVNVSNTRPIAHDNRQQVHSNSPQAYMRPPPPVYSVPNQARAQRPYL